MSPQQILAQNARLLAEDPSMHELAALPPQWTRATVAGWIGKLSRKPGRQLYFTDGVAVPDAWFVGLHEALALDALPETQPARFGLLVQRASLRTFPDATRVFSDSADHDIDRFQESALFAGTPVAIAHRSRDGRWLFVLAPNYAAWIEADAVAEGARERVLGYGRQQPSRLITGARATLVFTPEEPRLSSLPMEMGMRLPLAPVAADTVINGQNAYTSWPLLLPAREPDGSLALLPALLPKVADSSPIPLPLTQANLLRQSFKFLGERYGWGHDYQGRDCSGFVAEVYRSLGVELPRNTGDQSRSPVLANRSDFGPGDGREARVRALASVRAGDLLYIPGHLMMALGHVDGELYVIHDIQGGSWLDARGELQRMHLNGVSVTPFAPLRFDDATDFTDRLTSILRIP
jgi:cell wall-associated NlpC family hydrolase